MKRKTYCIVGCGSRAQSFINTIYTDNADVAELLALCDTNHARMEYHNSEIVNRYHGTALPMYDASEFDIMLKKHQPDYVLVISMDRTHHTYICRAMQLGFDVITEKPMTIDTEKCRMILDAVKDSNRELRIAFNYRYIPRNTKVKELLSTGILGKITTVHFEWLLDTSHGADYFRRWHRDKRNSGGLLVHKASHHFDLVNWWLESYPETVYAQGKLAFYGKENAEKRGIKKFYYRCKDSKTAQNDPWALHVTPEDTALNGLYFGKPEEEDGYCRDLSVFSQGISIEDNMALLVHYRSGALMTYSLNAFSPYEGYRISFTGTKGRLEVHAVDRAYILADQIDNAAFNLPGAESKIAQRVESLIPELIYQPQWGRPRVIEYEKAKGGHDGCDPLLFNHLFRGVKDDPLNLSADYIDGVRSIMTGIAGNLSIQTGNPINLEDLIPDWNHLKYGYKNKPLTLLQK